MTLAPLSCNGWSITDFEQAIAGIRDMSAAALGIVNQPRSSTDTALIPGACHLETYIETFDCQIDYLTECLRAARFPDPYDEDRRLRLLLRLDLEHSSLPVAESVTAAFEGHARPC